MKKVLSLILVFALAVGLGVGVSFVQKDISAADINPTPEQGATVNLLEGDPLDFATHYSKGAINNASWTNGTPSGCSYANTADHFRITVPISSSVSKVVHFVL